MTVSEKVSNFIVRFTGIDNLSPIANKVTINTKKVGAAINGFLIPSLKRQREDTDKTTKSHQSLTSAMGKVVTWAIATGMIYGTIRALKTQISTMIDVEYEIAKIRVVTHESEESYSNLTTKVYELAKAYGTSTQEIVKAVTIWAQQGKSLSESLKLTETALLGVNVTGLSTNEIVEDLTSAMKSFGIGSNESVTILDKWVKVASKSAVTMQTLANASKRSAEAAGVVGLSIDELNGLFVALGESTRMTGEQIGTSVKTMVTRVFKPQSKEILRTVADINIYTDESQKKYKALGGVLDELAIKWGMMSNKQKMDIALGIAGIRKGNEFITMMNHYDRAIAITIASLTSQGMALRANNIMLDTQKKGLERLKAELQLLGKVLLDLGAMEFLSNTVKGFSYLSEELRKVISHVEKLDKKVVGLSGNMKILSTGAIVLGAGLGVLGVGFGSILAVIGGIILILLGIAEKFGMAASETEKFKRNLEALNSTAKKTQGIEVATIKVIKGLVQKYKDLSEAMKKSKDKKYQKYLDQIKTELLAISKASPDALKGFDFTDIASANLDALLEKIKTLEETLTKAQLRAELTGVELEIKKTEDSIASSKKYEEQVKRLTQTYKEQEKELSNLMKAEDMAVKKGETVLSTMLNLFKASTKAQDPKINELLESQVKINKEINDIISKGLLTTDEKIAQLNTLIQQAIEIRDALANVGVVIETFTFEEPIDGVEKIVEKTKELKDEWLSLEKTITDTTVRGIEAVLDGTSTWLDLLTNIGNVIRHEIIEGLVEAANISGMIRGMVEKTGLFGGAGAYALAGVPQYGAKTQQPSTFEQASGAMGAAMPVAKAGIMGTISSILPYVGIGMALGEAFGLFGKKDEAPMIISNANITVDEVNMYAKKVVPIGWYTGATITPRSIAHTDINIKVTGTDKLLKFAVKGVNDATWKKENAI